MSARQAAADDARGHRLRCIALGLRLEPERARTPATFAASVAASLQPLLEAAEPAADDGRATLLALPEHSGLLAMLGGERGAAARERAAAGASALEVLMALAEGHGPALGRVSARFPDVSSPGQLLHLAVVDTVVRTLVDTAVEVATTHGWWVSVGAALPDWREVAADAEPELADPSVRGDGPATMAVASGPQVYNRNLIVGPDGQIAAIHDKAYLVPVERDAAGGLGLTAVGMDAVAVAQLPFGRVATVISKDAWMPDVNERLDQLGAQLVLQPEAFDRWAVVDRDGQAGADLWPPDKFQRGGWWMVQRQPSFAANVTPVLVGAVGELAFDGQPLVAVPAPAGDASLGLLGQPPGPGWAAVGGWVHSGEPPAALADPSRRAQFEQQAGSPPATSADPIAVADVTLPGPPQGGASVPRAEDAEPSVAVGPPGLGLVPDLCSDGERVWLAWVTRDDDHEQAVVAAWGDGTTWSPAEIVDPRAPGEQPTFDRRWRPRVVADADGPLVAFLGFGSESWDLCASRRGPAGWSEPVRVDDADTLAGVRRERGHDAPTLVRTGEEVLAAWADLRWPWVLPQVRLSRSADGGARWGPSIRVDGGPVDGQPDPLAPRSPQESGGQATPALAATPDGVVLVAWTDHGVGPGPAIRLARVDPDGRCSPVQLPSGSEAAHRPALAADGEVVWLVEERHAQGRAVLAVRVSQDGGSSFGAPRLVDRDRPAGTDLRRPAVVAVGARRAVIVAEDERSDATCVVAAAVDDRGVCGPLRRVDDAPAGADARAPTATVLGGRLVVAWQDTREGESMRTSCLPSSALPEG